MMRTRWVWAPTVAVTTVLALSGCSSDPGAEGMHDAAEQMLAAISEQDIDAMCNLMADPDEGPLPEAERANCERWATDLTGEIPESEREALADVTVETVTLTDDENIARVQEDDYGSAETVPPEIELLRIDERWYVTDVH